MNHRKRRISSPIHELITRAFRVGVPCWGATTRSTLAQPSSRRTESRNRKRNIFQSRRPFRPDEGILPSE